MSGDWIKMRDDLTEDPAVVSIGEATALDEFAVVGRLHALWSWAGKHSVDGNAVSVTPQWIDRKVGCVGFAAAMIEARWLESDGKTVTFPRFDRHNGETAKKRAVTNKRVAEHREVKRSSNADVNADSVTDVTHAALQKALPEKRREEKKEDQKLSSAASPADPSVDRVEGDALTLTPPVDLGEHKAERLRQVTDDAIAAFNARLGKPAGLLPAVHATIGREKRQAQVKRCARLARQICEQQFGSPTITREFWDAYFAEIDTDPFLSGRQQPGRGHENWTPSFEYLTREDVMLKVFDRATSSPTAGAA